MERNTTVMANATGKNVLGLAGLTGLTELADGMKAWASVPVKLLARYYSSELGRKVSERQTLRLIEVQAAFFAGVFPADCNVALRLAAAAWFVSALLRCHRAMKGE